MTSKVHETNRELFLAACSKCGFNDYPATPRQLLGLAKVCEYDVTFGEYLDDVGTGAFTPPEAEKYFLPDCLRYLGHLEASRRFLPGSVAHASKLTLQEQQKADQQLAAMESFVTYCRSLAIPDLLQFLVVSDDERHRGLIVAVLSESLQADPQRN